MKNSEVLRDMYDLLARPGGWTQGVGARDEQGREVGARYGDAHSFCLIGAAAHVSGWTVEAMRIAERVVPYGSAITEWNDAPERTQDDVLTAIAAAIERAEAAEQEEAFEVVGELVTA